MNCCGSSWGLAPDGLRLIDDEVHIWRARLDEPPHDIRKFWGTLTADERDRAERFHFERDRNHFTVARGILRSILGRYLGVSPAGVRLRYGPNGKPALVKECGGRRLRFNLSHSRGLALFAFGILREIGIDLEWAGGNLDFDSLAEQSFSVEERDSLRILSGDLKRRAFYNCWTRKEAYIKARGEGLSIPLDQFQVSIWPGEPARLVSTDWDTKEPSVWSVREIDPGSGYVAAIAVKGHNWRMENWSYSSFDRGSP